MRVAVLNKKKCLAPKKCDYICRKFCPRVRAGDETITISEEDKKPIIDEKTCIGCNFCVSKCPFEAISIVNLPDEFGKKCVHQFSKNGFRLYNFPIPTLNSIVGILGTNGIGKSTAIKILSNELQANLGNYEKGESEEAVINFFNGTEAQSYFEKLFDKKIKASVKPQYIEQLPVIFDGKVIDLLKNIETEENFDKVVDLLEIRKILNRSIDNISGGELQRTAIAAAVLKKAEMIFFDEPSSYLDIKQRLKIAKFVREFSEKKQHTFVVEHDLVMLDYMTDVIHIFFGKKGAYGIVSMPYNTRVAINAFLDGYLKTENMRFRSEALKFEEKAPTDYEKKNIISSWQDFKITLGDFNLDVLKGDIKEKEIIGIIGPNGIGKTTFVKALAGIIPCDKIDKKVKISYKPQYIQIKEDVLVRSLFAGKDNFGSQWFLEQVLIPLEADKLLDKMVSTLSGGELQCVAIALCLSNNADIYIFDEPSAHLDVEKRIDTARIIKKVMKQKSASCFVVDHDLMLIDYIAEKLLVFSGESSIKGKTNGPMEMREGMNLFLKEIGISFRRDKETKRPRANKEGSQKHEEQVEKGEYYYE